jgi:hypothetical protein
MRFRFWIQIVGLVFLSVLAAMAIDLQDLDAWFQSPLSVIQPPGDPLAAGPDTPGVSVSPLSLAAERLTDLLDAPVWASLWLWMAIGLISFGWLALGLIRVVRRKGPPGN